MLPASHKDGLLPRAALSRLKGWRKINAAQGVLVDQALSQLSYGVHGSGRPTVWSQAFVAHVRCAQTLPPSGVKSRKPALSDRPSATEEWIDCLLHLEVALLVEMFVRAYLTGRKTAYRSFEMIILAAGSVPVVGTIRYTSSR